MRTALALLVWVAACEGADEYIAPPLDAEVDARPVNPFGATYDSPDDFPTDGCVPGSMAGFALADLWPAFSLRTEVSGGALHTFTGDLGDTDEAPHTLTADALTIRRVSLDNYPSLYVTHVCAVDAGGTLTGHVIRCSAFNGMVNCFTESVIAPPFRYRPGETTGEHLTLLAETTGSPPWPELTLNVRVDGDTAYLARGGDGLRILDLRDPAHPVERGHFYQPNETYYNDVKLIAANGRRYAIMASTPTHVVDVTSPVAPFLVAAISFSAHTLFIDGTTLYLASGFHSEVSAYDVSDPRAPRYLGGFQDPVSPLAVHDLYVEDGIAYLSATDDGMVVVDFRNPSAPRELGREDLTGQSFHYWHSPWLTRIGGRPVIVHGDEGGDGLLRLLDGDPASPTFLSPLGEWAARSEVSVHNVMAFGERAYLAHYRDGVRVFDLADPAAPVVIGYYNTWILGSPSVGLFSGALGLDLDRARRRIYVADSMRGLLILEGDATLFP